MYILFRNVYVIYPNIVNYILFCLGIQPSAQTQSEATHCISGIQSQVMKIQYCLFLLISLIM